jgi:baseplate J-like protein
MYRPAPRIEERSSTDIFLDICNRLEKEPGLDAAHRDRTTLALTRIFARYWEIVTARLNQALDKNFLAYLDAVGVSPIPPRAATVPLTFTPVANAPPGSQVPARTQVAAGASEGETEPVVFETLHPFALTTARLRHVISLDPRHNAQSELAPVADAFVPAALSVFGNPQPTDHVLFIGDGLVFGLDHIRTLGVRFRVDGGGAGRARSSLRWSVPGGKEAPLLAISSDSTNGLSESGEVVFETVGPWPEHELRGIRSRWMACQMMTEGPGNWSPVYAGRIELVAEVSRTEVPIETALADVSDIDVSKDFYPFGTRPTFGSTFYIASREVFSRPGTKVRLDIHLTNPPDAVEDPPIRRVHIAGHPRVWWEYWNGTRWARLADTDETKAFRTDGSVSFEIPHDFSMTTVRGIPDAWVRARLVSGDYGEDERWDVADASQPSAGMRHRASTLAPPSIQSVTASYTLTVVRTPQFVITCNERVYDDVSARVSSRQSVPVFGFPCGPRPALYLGCAVPNEKSFINHEVNLFVIGEHSGVPFSRSGAELKPVMVRWQFWAGSDWQDLDVVDESDTLTSSGVVALLVPEGMKPRTDFVDEAPVHWFRIVQDDDGAEWSPAVRGILTNTVLAAHTVTIDSEVLGSSHAAPDQVFHALRTPILLGELLQVLEVESASEIDGDTDGFAAEAIHVEPISEPSDVRALWLPWRPVYDFLESRSGDRHYVIDRQSGEIRFGDGRQGRIPPQGSNNIRLRRYQTGGGARGNKAANQVTQLRTALPYVDAVANLAPASGGVDVEDMDLVRHRGATMLRHRSRAVTREDYEDLAWLASREVGRAVCLPLRDLTDSFSHRPRPGVVSLVIVPRVRERKPLPDAALLKQVRSYLDRYRNPATDLVVIGPDYVQISVAVDVVVSGVRDAARIAADVKGALEEFLHPLFGGPAGQGWRLGERPERGDLYRLCAAVPGVTYVNSLRVQESEERSGAFDPGQCLIYSGTHEVTLRYARHLEPQPAANGLPGAQG